MKTPIFQYVCIQFGSLLRKLLLMEKHFPGSRGRGGHGKEAESRVLHYLVWMKCPRWPQTFRSARRRWNLNVDQSQKMFPSSHMNLSVFLVSLFPSCFATALKLDTLHFTQLVEIMNDNVSTSFSFHSASTHSTTVILATSAVFLPSRYRLKLPQPSFNGPFVCPYVVVVSSLSVLLSVTFSDLSFGLEWIF